MSGLVHYLSFLIDFSDDVLLKFKIPIAQDFIDITHS